MNRRACLMPNPSAVTTTALAMLAALVAAPTANAAITPNPGHFYHPQNGEELLEAVDLVKDPPPNGHIQGVIVLEPKTYVVDRTIVLRDFGYETIRGAEGGGTVITGTSSTKTLLDVEGENTRVNDVTFRAPSSSETYPLVRLLGRAQFGGAVEVPASAPNVTGIETWTGNQYSWENSLLAPVETAAANAPAVRTHGALRVTAPLDGGNPVLDVDVDVDLSTDERVQLGADITGGPETATVVRVRAGSGRLTLLAHAITVAATAPGASLLQLRGAKAARGSIDAHVLVSTLIGSGDGNGVVVAPGAESTASKVTAVGLLSLGSTVAIGCEPATTAPKAVISVDAIYREGTLAPTAACTLTEQRRVTGDPKFTDRSMGDLTPRWGSVLIDAAPATMFNGQHLSTYTKPDTIPEYGIDTPLPNDIGADEYQYSDPVITSIGTETVDNRGLVRYWIDATDVPDEAHGLTYEWRLPDGSTRPGKTIWFRWDHEPTSSPAGFVGFVRDITGIVRGANVWEHPMIKPLEPHKLFGEPPPGYDMPATATPDGTTPRPTTPTAPDLPSRAGTTTRPATTTPAKQSAPAKLIEQLSITDSRVSRAATKRYTGRGSARAAEGSATLRLSADANLVVSVRRSGSTKVIDGFASKAAAGTFPLRITRRLGSTTLAPGKYDLVVVVRANGRSERAKVAFRVTRLHAARVAWRP